MRFLLLGLMLGGPLSAQTPSISSIGYYPPTPRMVSPGQIITLFVQGLTLSKAVADKVPLPTSLGGVSVNAKSSVIRGFPAALPILRIDPFDPGCASAEDRCDAAAVTVQIPYEGTCTASSKDPDCHFQTALLTVVGPDGQTQRFPIYVDYHFPRPHVLTKTDSIVGPGIPCPTNCNADPLITHANGNVVTGLSPARAGETIVIYAVGLGRTIPAVTTGEIAPANVRADPPWTVLTFSRTITTTTIGIYPTFAGLVAGYVGLYQVNVQLPNTLPDQLAPCAQAAGGWNTELTLEGSFDTPVVFCVTP